MLLYRRVNKINMYNSKTNLRPHSSKRSLLMVLLAMVSLTLIGVAIYFIQSNKRIGGIHTQPENTNTPFSGPTSAEKQEVEQNKTKNNGVSNPSQPTPTPYSTSTKSAKISNSYFDNNSKQLVVQTELHGTGWQKCTLDLSQGAQQITRTVDTLYQAQFSTCLGFSIQVDDFPSSGTWNTVIHVANSDGQTYASDQVNVNIIK